LFPHAFELNSRIQDAFLILGMSLAARRSNIFWGADL